MKALIKHLVDNHIDDIVSKSLFDCHVKGVHSIMFLESPEYTIRLYVATPEHELYKNFPDNASEGMSLGFHPHHCNLTLLVQTGIIFNWEVKENVVGIPVTKYLYKSKIKQGETSFKKIEECKVHSHRETWLGIGNSLSMPANAIHTVACLKGELSAWFVFEGKEDKDYAPYCYTNVNPNNQIIESLYRKPTKKEVLRLLKLIGI